MSFAFTAGRSTKTVYSLSSSLIRYDGPILPRKQQMVDFSKSGETEGTGESKRRGLMVGAAGTW